ncbi:hypothetical protein BCR34DRAFT_604721 [Clohesyomyces aquaticus]|uniref:Ig-like domain-containing protein n=1 Tax=Clohesyomyces aquaticus TaxID=1231657 RepID=A0A1Y1Z3R5_9PLEO|nr:hypothetical protein BCR34DRAFT_604721 [Clohesyomyces aquaticus]
MRNFFQLAAFAAIFHLSNAQAPREVDIYNNARVACSFNFNDPSAIFAYTSETFPGDWTVGIGSFSVPPGFTWICTFPIIGGGQLVQTVTTQITAAPPATLVVPFPSVTVGSLMPGGTVSCTVRAGISQNGFAFIESFALVPNPTPVTSDTVVLVPTAGLTTTTTTTTLVQATETTLTPGAVTVTVATGTSTIRAKPTLTTKTITITLPPRTARVVSITTSTTTLTCLPSRHKIRRENRYERAVYDAADELFHRDVATETPSCFSSITTPTVYNTILSTTTTGTDTIVEVALTTTTSINTVTAATPTSFQSVLATITQTPTRTRYWWTVLKPTTVTKTWALTKTVTRVPKGLTACTKGTPAPQPSKCRNPVVSQSNGCVLKTCS